MTLTLRFAPLFVAALVLASSLAFQPVAPSGTRASTSLNGIFDAVGEFFEELDAFVDDATSRRLGNGSKFYGKRRSNFYGENDKERKKDRKIADPSEDYQGPTSSGFFKWMPDENGQLRPVTRMKEKNLERNPAFWDRVYAEDEK